jgi:hypothetical protein
MVEFTLMRGYATRLGEADEAPTGSVDLTLGPYDASSRLRQQEAMEHPVFWGYFELGPKVWTPLASG